MLRLRGELQKAKSLLEDAKLLLEKERFGSSINRSYYAALTAAKGALILFGTDPKTHEGVKTMVGKKLIMDGYMSAEYGKWFRSLLSEREDADYADFTIVDKNDAEEAYNNASAFIKKTAEVVDGIIKELR
ncbi:MAG: HEPN domain-containing protein [Nitrospirae bacterium]|nr:HEPN domain-containing protein [Nitrospirota bacterium]